LIWPGLLPGWTHVEPRSWLVPRHLGWVGPCKPHPLEPGWELAKWFSVVEENQALERVVKEPAGVAPHKPLPSLARGRQEQKWLVQE
jgi:hypothetical protein